MKLDRHEAQASRVRHQGADGFAGYLNDLLLHVYLPPPCPGSQMLALTTRTFVFSDGETGGDA